nr:hypothetical protein [Tanacetum cinerariifolium]
MACGLSSVYPATDAAEMDNTITLLQAGDSTRPFKCLSSNQGRAGEYNHKHCCKLKMAHGLSSVYPATEAEMENTITLLQTGDGMRPFKCLSCNSAAEMDNTIKELVVLVTFLLLVIRYCCKLKMARGLSSVYPVTEAEMENTIKALPLTCNGPPSLSSIEMNTFTSKVLVPLLVFDIRHCCKLEMACGLSSVYPAIDAAAEMDNTITLLQAGDGTRPFKCLSSNQGRAGEYNHKHCCKLNMARGLSSVYPATEAEMENTITSYLRVGSCTKQIDWMISCTSKGISLALLRGRTPRLDSGESKNTAEAIQFDCNVKATNIILQGLPSKVYALVSTHKVAKELWERIQMLMQGTSLTKQERECKLYDEFDKFAYQKGETLRDFYLRFSFLFNDMNMYNIKLEQFQVNTEFLNILPPEWSKFVTDVKLVRDLHTTNVDQLYAYLGQHEYHANEVRLMHERTSRKISLWWDVTYVDVNSCVEGVTWMMSLRLTSKLKLMFEDGIFEDKLTIDGMTIRASICPLSHTCNMTRSTVHGFFKEIY